MARKRTHTFAAFLLLISTGVTATALATTDSAEAASLSENIFLAANDLPKGFKQTEEHLEGLSDSPPAFAACHGQQSGLKVFQTQDSAPLQRVVDICWTFSTAADAQQFLASSSDSLAESAPPIQNFTPVGQNCKAYGGENSLGKLMGGDSFYNYYYIFRSGRVVVKLYGAEGPLATQHPTLALLLPIARAAAIKCQSF